MRTTLLAALVAIFSFSFASARTEPARHNKRATAVKANKKGLGVNSVGDVTAFGTSVGWYYDWGSTPPTGAPAKFANGVKFYPMLWGPKEVDAWSANAKKAIAAGSKTLLAMNEPDLEQQSHMTPQAAAAMWKASIQPLLNANPSVKGCSPAITNGGAPMGVAWMQSFLKECKGCTIDAICMHWYDSATNVAYFKNYFTDAQELFKKPIYITEFMGSGTQAQKITFLKTVVPWLNSQKGIARYAAFGRDDAAPFVQNGKLTTLGKAYAKA